MRTTDRVRARLRTWIGMALATALFVVALVAAQAPTSAQAYTGSDFQPGYIISDTQFYDSNAMTQDEIQAFLSAKEPSCTNSNCLSIYRIDTFSRAADRTVCDSYAGASGELASAIIFKVQQACGISARVLLVTLQKEQSLVTATGPSDSKLSRAMGYGCPDSANGACDSQFYGLYNQIYKAAWQFKRYSTPDPWGSYQPGVRAIQYKPSTSCGALSVDIQNNATAALYNYTPYVPDAAALANLHGTGDSCSSYGNRNFWVYYNDWFGDPRTTIPTGVTVSRLGGDDRYDVAVGISQKNFPGTVQTVYVANGSNYPDALSAAPAAALLHAPLLLVPTDSVPPQVSAELQRLAPHQIIVVGGPASVSDATFATLAKLAPTAQRLGGDDRYQVSQAIAQQAFPSGSATVYVATGSTFPDALSASAAAGSIHAPVVLVNSASSAIDPALVALLRQLGAAHIIIVGGEASVSPALQTALGAVPGVIDVRRISGSDRFVVSGQINRDAFTTSTNVYVASGLTYPDALSGAAVAGAQSAPLYVIPGSCVPSYVLHDIVALGATQMTILGGPASVTSAVQRFAQCL
ncbi:MAG: cell wall-binding repeat-containing protein [Pseudolysinimonas sp.]